MSSTGWMRWATYDENKKKKKKKNGNCETLSSTVFFFRFILGNSLEVQRKATDNGLLRCFHFAISMINMRSQMHFAHFLFEKLKLLTYELST